MTWRYLAALLVALLGLGLGGCTRPGTDWSTVKPGVTRAQVEAVLGKPIKSVKTATGQIDTYEYDEDAPPVRVEMKPTNKPGCILRGTCGFWLVMGIIEGTTKSLVYAIAQQGEIQIS